MIVDGKDRKRERGDGKETDQCCDTEYDASEQATDRTYVYVTIFQEERTDTEKRKTGEASVLA
jgi:hypothetical protein